MARRKGQVCVLFQQVPDGTHYREGTYSWVDEELAEQYIEKGYGQEYDPARDEATDELEPAEPDTDIPEDFPGDAYFKQAGIMWMEDIEQLYEDGELQDVEGIGESTEAKIQDYFGD